MGKDITFLINTSELTAGTRGASLGPMALVTAARSVKSTFFGMHSVEVLPDWNHLLDHESNLCFAKYSDGLLNVFNALDEGITPVLMKNHFPFILAGDHGSAGGTIATLKKNFPDKRLGVIWIDAHGDIHSPYTTPSGNMHGMPLATALNQDNIKGNVNQLTEIEVNNWNALKNIHGIAPKISPEDLIFIGVRDLEEQEEELINHLNIKNYTVDELRAAGPDAIAFEVIKKLEPCDAIYISFDVDSMDPDHTSYGTGTPVKNGLFPKEIECLISHFLKSEKVVCLEFVEVNPCLDNKKNKMAEIAFDLVVKFSQIITQ
jgi:arginase